MPNTSLYLDAAHAGWLGWSGNREKIAKIFSDAIMEQVRQEMADKRKAREFERERNDAA